MFEKSCDISVLKFNLLFHKMLLFNCFILLCDGNAGFSVHLYTAYGSGASLQAQTSSAMQMLLSLF